MVALRDSALEKHTKLSRDFLSIVEQGFEQGVAVDAGIGSLFLSPG